MTSIQLFGVLLLLAAMAEAANILLLPTPLYSHCLEVAAVGGELAARGHRVKIFIGSNFDHKNCFVKGNEGRKGIEPIVYKSREGLLSPGDMFLNMSQFMKREEFNFLFYVAQVLEFVGGIGENILCDEERIMALKKEKFDLAIVDGFFLSYPLYVIPYVLKIPFVSVSTLFDDSVAGRPTIFSSVPSVGSKFTDKMSFGQKLANGAFYIVSDLIGRFTIPTEQIQKYIPGMSAQEMLKYVSKSELFIYNHDTLLDYPVPLMPNHILAGGLATQPAKPLKGEFKELYRKSTNGIVLVTFGSTFGGLPVTSEENLYRTFKRLDADVIWKYIRPEKDGNIIKVSWLPQNDLLGDPKTKLFISHCGNNGLFEALYHGVPILCTPLFGDQFTKAIRVEYWNVGRYVNIKTASEEEIFEAISDTLNNPIYRENMQKASAIFHSRPLTPKQRAAVAVEHVLKFGGEHLKSRATDMSMITLLGYDLVIFILAIGCVVVLAMYKSCNFCCRCCCYKEQRKIKKS